MIRQRYRNTAKNACSYPGTDADTDHNLVVMRTIVKFKKIQRSNRKKKWDTKNLESISKREAFQKEIEEKVKNQSIGDKSVDDRWEALKVAISESAENNVGYKNNKSAKKPWITTAMINKMQKRRKFKSIQTEEGSKMYTSITS